MTPQALQALSAELVCPQCRAALEPAAPGELPALRCLGEHRDVCYPLLDGALPLLVERPAAAWGRVCVDLREMARDHAGWLRALDEKVAAAAPASALRERLERLRRGEAANGALLDQVRGVLERGLAAQDALAGAAESTGSSSYVRDLSYVIAWLRRDHGGRAESEAELQTYLSALRRELDAYAPPTSRGSLLVLGAGLGRVAWELQRDFPRVLALDNSPLMGALFALLRRGPVAFTEINVTNARTPADEVIAMQAALRPAAEGARFDFLLADATRLPLPGASQSAVVSLYFTDVVPLSRLLPELRRVLRPGGLFVHFGPAGYHFTEIEEQQPIDQIPARFTAAGFEVHEPRTVPCTLLSSAARVEKTLYDNLCFSATLRGRGSV